MMMPSLSDGPSLPAMRVDRRPRLTGRFGSLDAFWCLIEPVLSHLQPRRLCEVGVEKGIFTSRLLVWGRENQCAYVGIDPAAAPGVTEMIQGAAAERNGATPDQLLVGRSLDILPVLESCEAYFLDGDHNYHTVRHELELIRRTALSSGGTGASPVIFMHDVSWPFARRDMYHDPAGIPADARLEYSEHLGVAFDGDDLIEGGFRSPGQYAIATRAGGPCNGVLTAVEDFLASDAGQGWQSIIVPTAYGLAILYRPDDASLPAGCRDHLDRLRAAVEVTGDFLESSEANFLTMYLFSEHARFELEQQTQALSLEKGAHYETLDAYKTLENVQQKTLKAYESLESVMQRDSGAHERTLAAYGSLEQAMRSEQDAHQRTLTAYQALDATYKGLSAHVESSAGEYRRLQDAYADLSQEYQALLGHYHNLQRHADQLAATAAPRLNEDGHFHPGPEAMTVGYGGRD